MLRTADRPPRSAQKIGLLRVLKALAAVARYCGRNAGSLFLLVWFPCLMVAASQIVLDWLSLSFPPVLPARLLSANYNPPTWLTAVAETPWGAMAWAFVLADMNDRHTKRGLAGLPILRRLRLRFELGLAILVAAVLFSAVNLLDGGLRILNVQLLAAVYERFGLSDELLNAIGRTGQVLQVIVMAALVATSYLAIGQLLPRVALQPPQRHLLDQVALALCEDQVGTLARRQDVLVQIDKVDARPDRARSLDRVLIGELRIAMEIGLRIAEGGAAQRQKAIDVPAQQHILVGVEVDREVEKVRHIGDRFAVLGWPPGLQHIEPFDNQDIGLIDRHPLIRLHVVDEM